MTWPEKAVLILIFVTWGLSTWGSWMRRHGNGVKDKEDP
jgi:hypothetical protein